MKWTPTIIATPYRPETKRTHSRTHTNRQFVISNVKLREETNMKKKNTKVDETNTIIVSAYSIMNSKTMNNKFFVLPQQKSRDDHSTIPYFEYELID